MKLIKRNTTRNSNYFTNKEAQYIAHQLLSLANPAQYYSWSNKAPKLKQFTTPFKTTMSLLKSLCENINHYKSIIKKLRENEEERERQQKILQQESEEKILEEKEQQIRNAYCGIYRSSVESMIYKLY